MRAGPGKFICQQTLVYVKTGSNPTNYLVSKLFAKIIFLKKNKGFLGYFRPYWILFRLSADSALFIYLFNYEQFRSTYKNRNGVDLWVGLSLLPCYPVIVLSFFFFSNRGGPRRTERFHLN